MNNINKLTIKIKLNNAIYEINSDMLNKKFVVNITYKNKRIYFNEKNMDISYYSNNDITKSKNEIIFEKEVNRSDCYNFDDK
jgi:hypothetical protein